MNLKSVPIFIDEKFNGNGFIFKNLLIAPSHVMPLNAKFNCFIEVDWIIFHIKLKDLLFAEYENENCTEKRQDLIIFKIDCSQNNEYLNSVENIITETVAFMSGYKAHEDEELRCIEQEVKIYREPGYQYVFGKKPILQNNVFEIVSKDKIEIGMSGSLIYNKDGIFGMLISNVFDIYTCLKAQYIVEVINSIK